MSSVDGTEETAFKSPIWTEKFSSPILRHRPYYQQLQNQGQDPDCSKRTPFIYVFPHRLLMIIPKDSGAE